MQSVVLAATLVLVPTTARADPAPWTQLGFPGLIDPRAAIADGETDWRHSDNGKLRFGGDHGDATPYVAIGDAHLL